MEVTKNKDISIGYFLNEKKLIELESILKEVSTEIQYSASCIDGTSIDFSDLGELINYQNRKEKQYKQITISNDHKSSIRISLSFSNRDFEPISYRISGDERNVDYYSRKIEDFIMSLKQWYSFLAVPPFWFYFLISTPIIILLSWTIPETIVEGAIIGSLTNLFVTFLYVKF